MDTKTVVEVKPKSLAKNKDFNHKYQALKDWANKNNYKCVLITENYFFQNFYKLDLTEFDEKTATKLRKLYETCVTKKNKKS